MNEWKGESYGNSLFKDGKIFRPNKSSKPVRSHSHRKEGFLFFGSIYNVTEPRGRFDTIVSEGDYKA